MGNSRPPATVIDLVDSFARRRDGRVEITLANPDCELGGNPFVVLRQGDRKMRAPAQLIEDDRGRRLLATVPAGRLRGTWRLLVNSDDGKPIRLQARLLVQGPRRPVVLLWGHRTPTTRLPVPHPRGADSARSNPVRAVARKALSALPDKRANQVRNRIHALRR